MGKLSFNLLEKAGRKADLKYLVVLAMSRSLAGATCHPSAHHVQSPPCLVTLTLTAKGLFMVPMIRTFQHLLWLPTVNTKRTNSLIY